MKNTTIINCGNKIPTVKQNQTSGRDAKYYFLGEKLEVRIKDDVKNMIIFDDEKHQLIMSKRNGDSVAVKKTARNIVTFNELFENVDMHIQPLSTSIKTILEFKTNDNNEIELVFETNDLLFSGNDEKAFFVDSVTLENVFELNNFALYDDSKKNSEKMNYRLEKENDVTTLTMVMDESFLNDETTVFPVFASFNINHYEMEQTAPKAGLFNVVPEKETEIIYDSDRLTFASLSRDGVHRVEHFGSIEIGRHIIDPTGIRRGNELQITIDSQQIKEFVNREKTFSACLNLTYFGRNDNLNSLSEGFNVLIDGQQERVIYPSNSAHSQNLSVELSKSIKLRMSQQSDKPITISFVHRRPQGYLISDSSETGGIWNGGNDTMSFETNNSIKENYLPELKIIYNNLGVVDQNSAEIEFVTGTAGISKFYPVSGGFTHTYPVSTIASGPLMIDLNHIYSERFANSRSGSSNEAGFGRGWKSNLHQRLYKSQYLNKVTNGREIIYTDGTDSNHYLYERWFYETEGTKHYVNRKDVLMDSDNLLKVIVSGIKHQVKYDVKSESGLRFISASGMMSYPKTDQFIVEPKFYMEITLNNVKHKYQLVKERESDALYQMTFDESIISPISNPAWLDNPSRTISMAPVSGLGTQRCKLTPNLYGLGKKKIKVAVLYDEETGYYINAPIESEEINFTAETPYSQTTYRFEEKISVKVDYEYLVGDDISEVLETEDLARLDEMITSYEGRIKELISGNVSLTTNLAGLELQARTTREQIARQYASNVLTLFDMSTDGNGKRNLRYDLESALTGQKSSLVAVDLQKSELVRQISSLQNNLEDSRYKLKNLKLKQAAMTSKQKDSVHDLIVDLENNVLGFDFFGRLIFIEDKYENQIEIRYQENSELMDKIISSNGVTTFLYDDEKELQHIIDERGIKTSFSYQNEHGRRLTKVIRSGEKMGNIVFEYYDNMTSIDDGMGHKTAMVYEQEQMSFRQLITIDEKDAKAIKTLDKNKVMTDFEIKYNGDTAKIIDLKSPGNNLLYTFDRQGRTVSIEEVVKRNDQETRTLIYNDYSGRHLAMSASAKTKDEIISLSLNNSSITTKDQFFWYSNSQLTSGIKANLNGVLLLEFEAGENLANKEITVVLAVDGQSETNVFSNLSTNFLLVPFGIVSKCDEDILFAITSSGTIKVKSAAILQGEFVVNKYDLDNRLIEKQTTTAVQTYQDFVFDKPTQITSKNHYGKKSTKAISYDSFENVVYVEDELGNAVEINYDGMGQVIEEIRYNKHQASDKTIKKFSYDELGNVVGQNDLFAEEQENLKKFSYAKNSHQPNQVKMITGQVTNFAYDRETGELLEMSMAHDGFDNRTTYRYQLGDLVGLSHHGFDIDYLLDGLGRKKMITVAGEEMMSFNYDDEYVDKDFRGSKVVSSIDDLLTTTIIKDEDGMVRKTIEAGADVDRTINYTYDTENHLTNIANESGMEEISNTYRLDGLLIHRESNNEEANTHVEEDFSYDENNRLHEHMIHALGEGGDSTYQYNYNEEDELKKIVNGDLSLEFKMDKIGRLTQKELFKDNQELICEEYQYLKTSHQATNLINRHTQMINGQSKVASYQYDEAGNIVNVRKGLEQTNYTYDLLNRLIKEDNEALEETSVFEYDSGGNMILSAKYRFKNLDEKIQSTNYTYKRHGWRDQLTSISTTSELGEEVVNFNYDKQGNPILYKDNVLAWTSTGRLASYANQTYQYNMAGIRTGKVVNGVKHQYYLSESRILKEVRGSDELLFKYLDELPTSLCYNKDEYFYQRDINGDITGIIDSSGLLLTTYVYDSSGNHKVINHTSNLIGEINPFRYRSYYFDQETGLYYLNSRYYDPTIRRFISADTLAILDETKAEANGLNLYVYCGNNPVMYSDPSGFAAISFLIGLGIAVVIGMIVGAVGYATSVVIVGIITGNWSWSWGQFLGSIIGGAVGGALTFFSPLTPLAVIAGLTGLLSTVSGMTLENAFGEANHTVMEVFLTSIVVGIISAVAGGILDNVNIIGFSSGTNSFSAISKSMMTKFRNGIIKRISLKTFGKILALEAFNDSLGGYMEILLEIIISSIKRSPPRRS